MSRKSVALMALALAAFVGCGTGPRLYDGPRLPPSSVAILENARDTYLMSVDGRSLQRWSHTRDIVRVELLPGPHTFVAGPSARSGFRDVSGLAVEVSFVAEAGHVYRVSRTITGGAARPEWTLLLTDVTTGRQLLPR
jgi:hypothetical protein